MMRLYVARHYDSSMRNAIGFRRNTTLMTLTRLIFDEALLTLTAADFDDMRAAATDK